MTLGLAKVWVLTVSLYVYPYSEVYLNRYGPFTSFAQCHEISTLHMKAELLGFHGIPGWFSYLSGCDRRDDFSIVLSPETLMPVPFEWLTWNDKDMSNENLESCDTGDISCGL